MLDAAATMFALRGVDAVSLRDIAAAADVHLELIRLYAGTREKLVLAVFDRLSDQVARAVTENPLPGQEIEPDTVMGKWVRVAGTLAIAARPVRPGAQFNPVQAMARTLEEGYGLDSRSARLRTAQIVAAALGWRIIEDYLVQAGGRDAIPLATLRDELARSARRLGAPLALASRPSGLKNRRTPRVPGLRTVGPGRAGAAPKVLGGMISEYHRAA